MKIYLNAGHGGSDDGAIGVNGRKEKDETLKLALAIKPMLISAGHEVIMEREKDIYKSVTNIAAEANKSGADLFVAIHLNAFNGSAKGTETLVVTGCSDKSLKMATEINKRITGLWFTNRGVKVQDTRTYVLKATKMPATTVEVCFIDNQTDMALYDKQFNQICRAITDGICTVAGGAVEEPKNDFTYIATKDTPLLFTLRTIKAGEKIQLDSYFEGNILGRAVAGDQKGEIVFKDFKKA
jgi:N-acetylmuramoyl-L-alanine amidase